MKSLLLSFILLFSAIWFFPNSAFSSHVSGGDISYECIGNNQYNILLNLFRDCSGIDMSTSEIITIQSSCGTQTLTATLENTGGTEISQLCPAQQPNSTCNGGVLPGMQRYTYTATATMVPCADWTISWTTCCRNTTVNVPTSSGDGSYIEATLNSVIDSCNNSPVFTAQPIPYVCANTQVIYNWGITEIDGDSLSYSLFPARSAALTDLIYSFPYSAANPIDGITIDPLTGQLTFTPTTLGNFIVAILVNEYNSNGDIIGTTMRDIQFVVQTCSNIPPMATQGQISNLTGTSNQINDYELELCDGGYFSFDITITDTNSTDILTLTSNVASVLPGASFVVSGTNPINATISWTAPGGSVFFNYFTVFANDGACPIPGIQSFVYKVSVIPGTVAGPDTTILCGAQIAQIGATGGNNFVWSVVSGDSMIVGTNFSCDSCPDPIASPAYTTLYEVVSDLTTSTCVNRDTVEVKVVPDFSFTEAQSDSAICLQEQVQFVVFPDTAISSSYSFDWTPSSIFDFDTLQNPTGTFNTPGIKTVFYQVTSAEGCVKTDSMQVLVSSGLKPNVMVVADTSICIGDSSLLTASIVNAIPLSCGISPTGCIGVPAEITVGTGTSTLTNTSYPAPYGNWYYGARHQILFLASELQALGFNGGQIASLAFNVQSVSGNSLYPDFTIKMGCTNQTSISTFQTGLVTVFGPQNVTISTGWNTHIFSSGFDWDGTSNVLVEVCFFTPTGYTYNSPTYYSVTSFPSVVWVNQDANPSICTVNTSSAYSPNNAYRPNVKFSTCGGTPPTTYVYNWSPSTGLSDSSIIDPWASPPSDTSYTVIVTDTIGGCADTASVSLHVVPTFGFVATQSDSVICKGDWVQFTAIPDTSTPPYSFSWVPPVGVTLDNNSIFNPIGTFDSSGTNTVYFTIANSGGCEKNDSMTVFVGNAPKPIVSIFADTTICAGDSTQLSAVISNGGPASNYTYSWSPGTGLSDSASSVPWSAPFSDTSLYTIIVKDTVGDCSDTVSINLYIIPSFSFSTFQSDDTICMQEQVQFLLTTDSSSAFSFYWTPGNILDDSVAANPIGTFFSPGTKIIHLDIANASGCSKEDSLLVFVSAAVKPDVTVSGDSLMCSGDSTQLNATINNSMPTSCGLSLTGCSGNPTLITVGTGTSFGTTTSYPAPYGNFYWGAKHQMLFTKAELNALGFQGGQITSLALNVQSISGTTIYNSFEIKMGCTSLSNLTTSFQSGLVTVFPAQNINVTNGWNTHTFSTGYDWDGQANLIVQICFNNSNYTNNSPTYYTTTSFTSVVYFNSDNSTVCSNTTGTTSMDRPNIRFNTCGGAPASSFVYSWIPGTGLNDPSSANPWATPPPDITLYSVIVTDSIGGCADTATISVEAIPLPDIQISPLSDNVCYEDLVVSLSATPAGGTWSGTGTTVNGYFSPSMAGLGSHYVYYSSTVPPSCTTKDSLEIVVYPNPIAPSPATNDPYCANSIIDSIYATSGGGNLTWFGNSTLTDTLSTTNSMYNIPAGTSSFDVWVNETSLAGCKSDSTKLPIVVLPNPNPTAYTNHPFCAFSKDTIFALSQGGAIVWYADSALTDTFCNGPFCIINDVGSSSFYLWVTETSPQGCVSDSAFMLPVQVVHPVASFSADPPQGYAPLEVSFENSSQPIINSFEWDFAGLGASNSVNPSFIFQQPGIYDVTLITTDTNGCKDVTKVKVVVDIDSKLVIPNIFTPNGDGFNDEFKVQYTALNEFHMEIFNRWGRKVHQSDDPDKGWDGKDLQGQVVSDGVYFYVISARDRLGELIDMEEIKGTVTLVK